MFRDKHGLMFVRNYDSLRSLKLIVIFLYLSFSLLFFTIAKTFQRENCTLQELTQLIQTSECYCDCYEARISHIRFI